ncbi:hypothetical protein COC69_26880 [Bacillus cereus]|uniref:Uncharacterized protein n=1 Tax=Bacillus cereus TaxID=1396 RepID=A0A9X7GTJ5_BACCE|nr:hypothetical protein [Bacillus cereus]PGS68281.1 hypothetical protein COC69_26880 [Bacillus cereus]
MQFQVQAWKDMLTEQKQQILKRRIIENRNYVVNEKWKALCRRDQRTFQQCAKVCRVLDSVLARS